LAISACATVALIAGGCFLSGYVGSSRDLVLVRNSLVHEVAPNESLFAASPTDAPQTNAAELDELSRAAMDIAETAPKQGAFQIALALVRHLDHPGVPLGGAISADTLETYRTIRNGGQGYCADYTAVFLALARGAGLHAREWGISFTGYSGDGHAVVEVYSPELEQWIFIDAFNGFYVAAPEGRPLSFMQLRRTLGGQHDHALRLERITDELPFSSPDAALKYLSAGLSRAYLSRLETSNVFESDPVLSAIAPISRKGAQVAAIIMGKHPKMTIVPSPRDRSALVELAHVRLSVIVCGLALPAILICVGLSFRLARQSKRIATPS